MERKASGNIKQEITEKAKKKARTDYLTGRVLAIDFLINIAKDGAAFNLFAAEYKREITRLNQWE